MQRKEIIIPNCPQVYRLVEIDGAGKAHPTGKFRVRKRVKNDLSGKWSTRTKTFSSIIEAKSFARANYKPLKNSQTNKASFKEVFDRFIVHKRIKKQLRRGSLDGWESRYYHLKFFEAFPVHLINARVVDRWLDLLHDPRYKEAHSAGRLDYKKEYSLLSGILKYYRNYENEDYMVPLLDRHREVACTRPRDKIKSEVRFLTEDEEKQFLDALVHKEPVFRDLALFQLHTGARIGEASALEFRNIDFRKGEVHIAQHLDWPRRKGGETNVLAGTKTGANRWVPLTQECKTMLLERMRNAKSQIVFPDPRTDSSWLAYRQIQFVYDRAFVQVSDTVKGSHSLRHTFAVRYLNATKDIHALQKLLGHATLEETQVYAKYTSESVRKSFQLFRGGQAKETEGLVPQLVPQIG